MERVSIIVPAAGSASWLGRNKLLVTVDGEPVIRRAIRAALASRATDVTVVTGYEAELITEVLQDLPCTLVTNQAWQEGLETSLRTGLECVLGGDEDPDAVLIVLPDQVLVTAAHLDHLIAQAREAPERSIVATRYGETADVPALFKRRHFAELLALSAGTGARPLLQKYAAELLAVDNKNARVDLDTLADLAERGKLTYP